MIVHRGWAVDGFEAHVMAVADGYAMCRRPGCMPFVEPVGNLYEPDPIERQARKVLDG